MKIPDETLMAYVDGELEPESRAAVDAAIASDPEVARRVDQHRALRQKLHATFDGILEEAVPERLIVAARAAPAGSTNPAGTSMPPAVTDLSQARTRKAVKTDEAARRWSWPVWGAMAASLVLGLIIGQIFLRSSLLAPFSTRDGQLVAEGELANALSQQLASQQTPDAPIQIGLSFRAKSGDYCRTFALRRGEAVAGLACRDGNTWALQVLARNDLENPGGGDYRPASTDLPPAVLQAVEEQISGEPLDAEGEIAVQRKGWRAQD